MKWQAIFVCDVFYKTFKSIFPANTSFLKLKLSIVSVDSLEFCEVFIR